MFLILIQITNFQEIQIITLKTTPNLFQFHISSNYLKCNCYNASFYCPKCNDFDARNLSPSPSLDGRGPLTSRIESLQYAWHIVTVCTVLAAHKCIQVRWISPWFPSWDPMFQLPASRATGLVIACVRVQDALFGQQKRTKSGSTAGWMPGSFAWLARLPIASQRSRFLFSCGSTTSSRRRNSNAYVFQPPTPNFSSFSSSSSFLSSVIYDFFVVKVHC